MSDINFEKDQEEVLDRTENIKSLAELPHVYCKLSGIMAYCAPDTVSYKTIEPYVDTVLNYFGSDRIVWGSDWPVVNLGKGIQEWIKVTNSILNGSKLIVPFNSTIFK